MKNNLQRRPLRPVPAEWRADILAAARASVLEPQAQSPVPSFLSTLNSLPVWKDLSTVLWPCPQAWAGLAAVWLVILAVNHATADKTPALAQASLPPSPEMIRLVREQRRELAQLLEPLEPPPAEPPKPFIPRPRSEIRQTIAYV